MVSYSVVYNRAVIKL